MTGVLTAVVVVLAFVQGVTLLALREVSARQRRLAALVSATPVVGEDRATLVAHGAPAPRVDARTTSGRSVDDLFDGDDEVLVAFVSPGCTGCEEERSGLARAIATRASLGRTSLVVVSETRSRIGDYERDFPGAEIVADGVQDGPVFTAFGVRAVPEHLLVVDRVVVHADRSPGPDAVAGIRD